MTTKPQAKTIDEKPVFGDKVSVEQFRYGADNEFYIHKVIGTLKSNTYADVPQTGGYEEYIHKEQVDVVQVICEGVSEDKVLRYPVTKVEILGHRQALINEARIDELHQLQASVDRYDLLLIIEERMAKLDHLTQLKENK